jgi:hypothetical protein
VRVRAYEHVVAEPDRVAFSAAHHGVLHDNATVADLDRPALGRDHRAE